MVKKEPFEFIGLQPPTKLPIKTEEFGSHPSFSKFISKSSNKRKRCTIQSDAIAKRLKFDIGVLNQLNDEFFLPNPTDFSYDQPNQIPGVHDMLDLVREPRGVKSDLVVEVLEEPIPKNMLKKLQPLPIPPDTLQVPILLKQHETAGIVNSESLLFGTKKESFEDDDIPPFLPIVRNEPSQFPAVGMTERKIKMESYLNSIKAENSFELSSCATAWPGGYDVELSAKVGFPTRRIEMPHCPGKKPKVKVRWHLFCSHCQRVFFARPTPKNSRYVVNHQCSADENKRKQYIIGVKGRKCRRNHEDPCVLRIE